MVRNIDEDQSEWIRKFTITAWWIWKWRNERVLNANQMEINRNVAWIREADKEVSRAFMREAIMRSRPTTEHVLRLCWKPSSTHRFTLNVDASVKATMRAVSIGGLLRSAEGTGLKDM
ncbi:uncharacterized protein LOC116026975 [Ipomoea triloba]|uniref:uncharacterized protein LOC116026975 n=1 Tax=Ipomoea triloba TaxID=35885 RepID=UPI00125DDC3D|nr:uncharacterized protein LOC116026975 [Ipomoea triloba]